MNDKLRYILYIFITLLLIKIYILFNSLYDPAALNAPNIWAKGPLDKNVQKSEAQDMAEDIFKFGLLMLICSIGSFDLFEH